MACLTLLKVMGVSMEVRHGFCSMRSSTEQSIGLWLFSTFVKCDPNTDMFSLALDVSSPLSKRRMDMLRLVLWCAVSPPVSMQMFYQARRGSMLILWILSHMPLYQLAFANSSKPWLRLLISFSLA